MSTVEKDKEVTPHLRGRRANHGGTNRNDKGHLLFYYERKRDFHCVIVDVITPYRIINSRVR